MAVLQYRTLSNRTVATLSVERDTVFWDRELTGFGIRVYPSGGKVFVAQARGPDGPNKPNKPRRITVGRHPVLSAEQARQRAALIIARVKAGAGLGQKFSCHGKRFCVCLGSRLTNPPNTLAKAERGSGITVG